MDGVPSDLTAPMTLARGFGFSTTSIFERIGSSFVMLAAVVLVRAELVPEGGGRARRSADRLVRGA